jgi:hypothetical protein
MFVDRCCHEIDCEPLKGVFQSSKTFRHGFVNAWPGRIYATVIDRRYSRKVMRKIAPG